MSKRAEELFHKIRPYQPIGGVKAKVATPSADETIALIDAELRKERERAANRVRTKGKDFGLSISIDDACAAILSDEED